MENIIKALKSLISDIETMQAPEPNWFGMFSNGYWEGQEIENVCVEWPNLAISFEEAKKAITEYEKVLVIDHQQALAEEAFFKADAALFGDGSEEE